MNSGWKEAFAPWILERGSTYCQLGRVTVTEFDGHQLTADVRGNEIYHVRILFSAGLPALYDCTCPHAAGGALCKHMAAALMEAQALDSDSEQAVTDRSRPRKPDWTQALEELPPELLRVALRNCAEDDPVLQEMILALHRSIEMLGPE